MEGIAFRRARLVCRAWARLGLDCFRKVSLAARHHRCQSLLPATSIKLATLAGLEELVVSGPWDCPGALELSLRGLRKLATATFTECALAWDWLYTALLHSSLTSLALSRCSGVDDRVLHMIAHTLPGLTSLAVSDLHGISPDCLANLTGLTSLQLVRCGRVSKRGLSAVLSSLPNVRLLDLSYCHQ
eukprot:scaffold108485_cov31-Prasinocladus_malaysianus.AAC.1